jgi:hypothetical protein
MCHNVVRGAAPIVTKTETCNLLPRALRIRRWNNESFAVLMLLPCVIALALLAFMGGRRAADARLDRSADREKTKGPTASG